MKKSSKLLLTLSLMGLGITALASCSANFTNPFTGDGLAFDGETGSDENVKEHTIENAASEYAYLDGLPEKGEAGKSYSFRVSLKPGYHFNDKVSILSGEDKVDFTQEGDTYTFVMPDADIVIIVDVGQTNFTITNDCYFVSEVLTDEEDSKAVTSAVAGTPLKFEAVADIDFSFTQVTINGKAVEEGDDGFYHFTMPTRPVKISSDKNAISYGVEFKTELKQSTVSVYKLVESETEGEEPTKVAVEEAIKGETIYFEFETEIEHMEYAPTVKTVVDEGETPTELKVTPVGENGKVFSFEMVSSNIEIEAVENDRTLYYTSTVVGKAWKGCNVYGSSTTVASKTYDSMSFATTFNTDGTAKAGSNSGTWTPTEEGKGSIDVPQGSTTKNIKVVWTEHIMIVQYAGSTPSWGDAYYSIADDTYALHYFNFESKYRIAWIEDEESTIIESIVIVGEETYINPTILLNDEDGTAAKGSDITTTAALVVKEGDTEVLAVNSGKGVVTREITTTLADYVACEILDADGNATTSGVYGKTITIKPSLTEDAPSTIVLKTPTVTDIYGNKISISTVKGSDGEVTGYTFTMPITAANVSIETKDTSIFQNHPALGTYYVYEMWSTKSSDQAASSFSTEYTLKDDGTFERSSSTHEVEEISEGAEGTFKTVTSTGTQYDYCYSNGVLVSPYSASWNDVWAGVRVPEGHTKDEISNHVHYGENNGTKSSWAMSFFFGEELFGSVFCFEGQMYMGVTFTFDEGSTRINSTSSYHVVKDGVTLFDVSNNTFKKHVA